MIFKIKFDFSLTCIGVLFADKSVNPQISLKYIVTLSNDSAFTSLPCINWEATVLLSQDYSFMIKIKSKLK